MWAFLKKIYIYWNYESKTSSNCDVKTSPTLYQNTMILVHRLMSLANVLWYICSRQTHTFRFADCKFYSGQTIVLVPLMLYLPTEALNADWEKNIGDVTTPPPPPRSLRPCLSLPIKIRLRKQITICSYYIAVSGRKHTALPEYIGHYIHVGYTLLFNVKAIKHVT